MAKAKKIKTVEVKVVCLSTGQKATVKINEEHTAEDIVNAFGMGYAGCSGFVLGVKIPGISGGKGKVISDGDTKIFPLAKEKQELFLMPDPIGGATPKAIIKNALDFKAEIIDFKNQYIRPELEKELGNFLSETATLTIQNLVIKRRRKQTFSCWDLQYHRLENCRFENIEIQNWQFNKSSLIDTIFSNVIFFNCNFESAFFKNTKIDEKCILDACWFEDVEGDFDEMIWTIEQLKQITEARKEQMKEIRHMKLEKEKYDLTEEEE